MDALASGVQDMGLAQLIQGGLAKNQMVKPAFPDPAALDAKKGSVGGGAKMATYSGELGKFLWNAYATERGIDLSKSGMPTAVTGSAEATYTGGAPTEDTLGSYWDDFSASKFFDLYCKYMCLQEATAAAPITPKLWEEMRALGKGAFGAVFLVFKKDTAAPMAVKKMKKKIGKQNKMLKDILIEREVLSKVNSRFCVGLNYAWQNDEDVALVITLMPGGDLEYFMKTREDKKTGYKALEKPLMQFYIASMALGLQAVHGMGYVYRDLKPMNVLMDDKGQVRLSDMGLTADISKGAIKQCSGTRGYWSPETIKKEAYSTEPDWWSLGVTAFVLFCHKLPFFGSDEEKDAMTVAGVIEYKHDEPAELQKFITDLCTVDMGARCKGVDGLKAHPYFAGYDWASLEQGKMEAPFAPNVNDINAPDAKEIAGFVAPKDVTWDDAEKQLFSSWDFFNPVMWEMDEAVYRIKKMKELSGGGGGGGGGCCTIA